jgi:copper chaperone CopZ
MELEVKDMTCGHCAGVITKAVKDIDAQAKVDIDVATRTLRPTFCRPSRRLGTPQLLALDHLAGIAPVLRSSRPHLPVRPFQTHHGYRLSEYQSRDAWR